MIKVINFTVFLEVFPNTVVVAAVPDDKVNPSNVPRIMHIGKSDKNKGVKST